MAAISKVQLLLITQKEYDSFQRIIKSVDPQMALIRNDEGVSIKDIVALRAHWISLFLEWCQEGRAGAGVHFPAKDYQWNGRKRHNKALRDEQHELSWVGAQRQLADHHNALIAFIEAQNSFDLYSGSMKGARSNWTPGRWAEAAGASHYRSASRVISARLRALNADIRKSHDAVLLK
jgi:hypothetical protein